MNIIFRVGAEDNDKCKMQILYPNESASQNEQILHVNVLLSSGQRIGFASRPKIPRTPDSDAGSAGRSRLPTLAPQFSNSEPQQSNSRPGSAGGSGGRPSQQSEYHLNRSTKTLKQVSCVL